MSIRVETGSVHMVRDLSSGDLALRTCRFSGSIPGVRAAALVALSGLAIVITLPFPDTVPSFGTQPVPPSASTQASLPTSDVAVDGDAATLRPSQTDSLAVLTLPSDSGSESPTPFADQALADMPPLPDTALSLRAVPLPVPRPPELRGPGTFEPSRRAGRQGSRRTNTAALPVTKEDDRSFLEKLFGVGEPHPPALAYAALENPAIDPGPRRQLSPVPFPEARGGVAIYDISARIVILPNGEKLEAHSGLGESMDDPRYVDRRMRGATPPGTYDLTEREQPFHGVRALRLNPVGGSAAVHNRTGLLAHTYLLGPNGASNGCVSFKDYEKFLNAYLRGDFQRLVVVPGQGQDALPVVASKAAPVPVRTARRGSGNMRVATLP